MKVKPVSTRCVCGSRHFSSVFMYDAPPEGEAAFQFSSYENYRREILRCTLCGHFVSVHDMDASDLYTGDYVNSNYDDQDGIWQAFDRVNSLDPSQSDNVGRVQSVRAFAADCFSPSLFEDRRPTVLDVGSGLCVFLHRMKAAGWGCTALDPDSRSVRHARECVGVEAICGDFMVVRDMGRFDVVTLNKVLEHVEDPGAMLAKVGGHLLDGGFVYVEVPDGEAAVGDGPGRQEFFIDHFHVFSVASLALLAVRSGFSVQAIERVREPSGKYTLRAFLTRADVFRETVGKEEERMSV